LALPEEITAFELETFNDCLYIGTGTNVFAPGLDAEPFSVLRTDAHGAPPYTPIPVISQGGYRRPWPSYSVVSMHVFKGDLYVGTDRPAELFRIHPDDTWDLIVGSPRWTPDGLRRPLSGMDVGFDNPFNIHIWRMQTHHDRLYVGTMDQSTKWRDVPLLGRWLGPMMGFDLYATSDGEDFVMLTRDGFGDKFDVGLRNFASTKYGLVLGTANHYYGARLFRGGGAHNVADSVIGPFTVYLPLVLSVNSSWFAAPEALRVAEAAGSVALSWAGSPGASRYRVFRADFVSNQLLGISDLEPEAWIPGEFQQIGFSIGPAFTDHTARPDGVYHYYVLAETTAGVVSGPSNLARFPSLR
jgi:hypothetical protein